MPDFQQAQGAAARADEHEPRVDGAPPGGGVPPEVPHAQAPRAVPPLAQAAHLLLEAHGGAAVGDVLHERAGQGSEVHVGALGRPGRGDRLARVAVEHQERRPVADDLGVGGELEVGEVGMGPQRVRAPSQVVDVGGAPHEGHVRRGGEERVVGEPSAGQQEAPQLARELELLVDGHGLGDVDRAVGALRRVVELAEGGVPGARVVPGVRALLGKRGAPLEDLDLPGGLERRDHRGERRAHDPAADEDDIHWLLRAHG